MVIQLLPIHHTPKAVLDKDSTMSYFMGKEGFTWWQGVVEDRHDPLYLGRCKIRVLGWHSEDKNDQPTVGLPWAYPVAPITSASQTGVGSSPLGPVEGTWVLGFYRDGEAGQEPMFFGTLGGIPELDAKGVNNDGTATGGQGFLDPRLEGGDIGHPMFPDEAGHRDLLFNPVGDLVPREPATIIHNALPNPAEDAQTVTISDSVTLKDRPIVKSLIASTGPNSPTPAYTVKVVENPVRSTYPDTGLSDKTISTTRNLNYLKEPTTNRLARGIRGNTDLTDPRVSGIVFEKMENRKHGQMEISTAGGKTWSEPKTPWHAIYPYNHVHQTESGHIIEMDDTPQWERLHWYHRTGTFTEIHPTGIKVDKIVNNYYNIILGARYTHIEASDYTTIDGSQEIFVQGSKQDKIEGDYSLAVKKGRFNVNNPLGPISFEGQDVTIKATGKLILDCESYTLKKKTAEGTEKTTGDEKKEVGGKYTMKSGSVSMNTQGGVGIQAGGGYSVNATDSINESIFGLLPMTSMGYSKKTDATLGKVGYEIKDNLLSGGFEWNLGIGGIGASMSIMPLGDIVLDSKLGLGGITGSALLGPVTFSTAASGMELGVMGSASLTSAMSSLDLSATGDATMAGLMGTVDLAVSGAASMQGMLGEVTVSSSGKLKLKGLATTMAECINEIIEQFLNHTHPTGTGPSGPPMPPASVQMNLIKSMKLGMSHE